MDDGYQSVRADYFSEGMRHSCRTDQSRVRVELTFAHDGSQQDVPVATVDAILSKADAPEAEKRMPDAIAGQSVEYVEVRRQICSNLAIGCKR